MADTTTKLHADYAIAVEKAIDRIGSTNGSKLSASNDSSDAIVQEYAIAYMISANADKRLKAAKSALMKEYPAINELGMHVRHDSSFALCIYEAKNSPRQISADRLTAALMKHGIPADKIDAIIEASKGAGGVSTSIKVTLKQ
jgi:hypothetical protein